MHRDAFAAVLALLFGVGLAAAAAQVTTPAKIPNEHRGQLFTPWAGEPSADDAEQFILYWCSEAWATRGYQVDEGVSGDPDAILLGFPYGNDAPSRYGIAIMSRYWFSRVAIFNALADAEREEFDTAASADLPDLRAKLDVLSGKIQSLEAKIGAAARAPAASPEPTVSPRQQKLNDLTRALNEMSGYRDRLKALKEKLGEAERFWNLGNTSRDGTGRDQILGEISELEKTIANRTSAIVASGLVEAPGKAIRLDDFIAALGQERDFHIKESLTTDLAADDPPPPKDDAAELADLKIEREKLREKIATATREIGQALVRSIAARYQADRMTLIGAAIRKCIDDQMRHLGPPPKEGGDGTRSLPGGERVATASGTVTGFFKHTCDLPNSPFADMRHRVDKTGSMVIEFKEGNTVAIQLRAMSSDGNTAHDTIYTGTGTYDPATGQVRGTLVEPSKFQSDRFSATVTNTDARGTEVRGLMCSAPDPAHLDEYVATMGGRSMLAYCGGKFWGPEEVAEPGGPEREATCGF